MSQPDAATGALHAGVRRRLSGAWRRERRFLATRGVCYLLMAAAALILLDVALDWSLDLAMGWRTVLVLANIVLVGGILYQTWWRGVRRFDPVRVALQVERLYPQLKSLLVSYVQLHTAPSESAGMSPSLVAAMCRQAVEQAQPLDFGKIVRFRTLKKIAVYSVAAAAVVLAAGYLRSDVAGIFLKRLMGAQVGYPTRTTVQMLRGDVLVQQGRTATLAAQASGEVPDDATLIIRPLDGENETIIVPAGAERDSKREFSYRTRELYGSFHYRYRIGDALSREYFVKVVPPPHLEMKVWVTLPAYTRQPALETELLSLQVLAGSRITWQVVSDRPLASIEMVPDTGAPAAMTLADKALVAKADMTPDKNFSYGFRLVDKDYGFAYTPEVRYTIQIVPDNPPTVVLTQPTEDEKATARKDVNMAFTCRDDFGLIEARLVYAVEGKDGKTTVAEKTQRISVFKDNDKESGGSLVWKLDEALPALKAGDIVRYCVEVQDNRQGAGGPGIGRSDMRRLTILSPDEYLRWVLDERQRLVRAIQGVHKEETVAVDAVKGLGGATSQPASGTNAQPKRP
ncbi:MAG: DUF4175 domain-containing protein [Planctomycetaceae bacterium]|nr:DUF4175 domain-containing protein [Planctomycetaceae bacterium]